MGRGLRREPRSACPRRTEALVENLRLAEELEARVATLQGQDTADEILAYAREHNVTRIIVGKPTPAVA
jgi:two-component system sensor histidine kinase KdpD